jgi:hypothetical protein
MKNYVPFLKLKANEVGALKELTTELKIGLTPFFDIPRKKEGLTEIQYRDLVTKGARSIGKHLKDFECFFLDNFDIDDAIKVAGDDNYAFVIECFSELRFIPVVGLDRTARHNQVVLDARSNGKIASSQVALRLQPIDYEEFDLIKDELIDLATRCLEKFERLILIIDNRVCFANDIAKRSKELLAFIPQCMKYVPFEKLVITGSSIPASIGDLVGTNDQGEKERFELNVTRAIFGAIKDERFFLGDYTVVSPLYSDFDLPPEMMRNVTAPKIAYSVKHAHYFFRGASLGSHPRGNLQYNDLAVKLIAMPFYRFAPYSYGDDYLDEKAKGLGAGVTPSSIVKPTINAHMTYMCRDFKF